MTAAQPVRPTADFAFKMLVNFVRTLPDQKCTANEENQFAPRELFLFMVLCDRGPGLIGVEPFHLPELVEGMRP